MVGHYTRSAAWRAIVIATTIAGTLDLLSAFVFAVLAGGSPFGVLRGIAGAVIDPSQFADQRIAVLIGLGLHFSIMTVMAAVYLSAAAHLRWLNRIWLLSGLGYGVALWLAMEWVVLPLRWPTLFPTGDLTDIAMQLFSNLLLVGVPIALVTKRASRWH
jgi:hypothetical protein